MRHGSLLVPPRLSPRRDSRTGRLPGLALQDRSSIHVQLIYDNFPESGIYLTRQSVSAMLALNPISSKESTYGSYQRLTPLDRSSC